MAWLNFYPEMLALAAGFLGAALGAFVKSYGTEKGKNLATYDDIEKLLDLKRGEAYEQEKGKNVATHEDIQKLVEHVEAVTRATREIEAKISDITWRRERKYEWQLQVIESFNSTTSEYISNVVENPDFKPSQTWFAAFDVTGALIKILFDQRTYVAFKQMEILIGPHFGGPIGKTSAETKLYEARDAALKAMIDSVIGPTTV